MSLPADIAAEFSKLDFHDDTFLGMTVLPPQTHGDTSGCVIEMRYSGEHARILRFIGCVNLKVGIDFDVLADNLPINTSYVDGHTNKDAIWSLMKSQIRNWGVTYSDLMLTPLDRKADSMSEFACFRVQLFGGLVEIIARRYEVEQVNAQTTA